MIITCVRWYLLLQARSSFRSTTRCHVLYRLLIMAVYCFSRRRLPDLVTEELCLSYLKRGHTSSNGSSRLCMTISDDEMLPTEGRKFCDYALMTSSKSWCLAAQ